MNEVERKLNFEAEWGTSPAGVVMRGAFLLLAAGALLYAGWRLAAALF